MMVPALLERHQDRTALAFELPVFFPCFLVGHAMSALLAVMGYAGGKYVAGHCSSLQAACIALHCMLLGILLFGSACTMWLSWLGCLLEVSASRALALQHGAWP